MFWTIATAGIPSGSVQAQNLKSLTIEEAYQLAEANYPLSQKRKLILASEDYTVENALKGYLPQLSFNGQATYQSDVIQIPINVPGINIPTVSKAQYRFAGELNQTIFDGGSIRNQIKVGEANARIEEEQLTSSLYQLKSRINQLFFGLLALGEQLKQTRLMQQDIHYGIDKVNAAIQNGTAINSNRDELKAELLKTEQKYIELSATKNAFEAMLRQFISLSSKDSIVLIKPSPLTLSEEIQRPELSLFDAQKESIGVQERALQSRNIPKVNLFLQAGAGSPNPLNMLSNEFSGFYLGGVRLTWLFSGLYTLRSDRALLNIKQQNIETDRDNFLFNTTLQTQQQLSEIDKWRQLLATDTSIISLRKSVKNTALIQLDNGLITANDYLQQVNAEDQAQQNFILHKTQLLQAQYELKTITGN
ncbi:MAG TPA: TolC family protein [Flavipsychrobacter sp.]|nr:TolC family protein [Flavipsychrobacter sp.]